MHMETADLDETGKVVLDQIYNKSTPVSYYSTLVNLEYCIPQVAKPVFQAIIDQYRRQHGRRRLRIIDVGCSYGVNAALLKHGKDMPALYSHYAGRQAARLDRSGLLRWDAGFYGEDSEDTLEFIGVDTADRAISYAVAAGILDDGVTCDLEREEPTDEECRLLADADLVISTGCIGYVGEKTFARILDANRGRTPWFANFVLRMFPFAPMRTLFAEHGYRTEHAEARSFAQRRFASPAERARVRQNLDELGTGLGELERSGWLAAEFFLCRPPADIRAAPLDGFMPAP